jgi:membrane associated rhomboid family serine protease
VASSSPFVSLVFREPSHGLVHFTENGGYASSGHVQNGAGPAPVEQDPFEGLTAIGPVPNERKVRDWALVLQSMPVWHVARRALGGWVLFVRNEDYPRARRSIDRYEEENKDWPPQRQAKERPAHARSPVVGAAFALLVAFFMITGPISPAHGAMSRWFERGIAVSDHVLHGAPWQAVTALTLHADAPHVLGNAISGTIFGTAVARRLGSGAALLAIVATGALGNVANALYHHLAGSGDHGSLGASTAVFATVGLLAATQLVVDRSQPTRGKRNWTDVVGPIVGGFALLGTLGASPTSDLGAHLFGFLAGLLFGVPAALLFRRNATYVMGVSGASTNGGSMVASPHVGLRATPWWAQTVLGAIAAGLVIGSWILAFKR